MRKAVHLGMLFLAYGTPPRAQEAVPIRIDDRVRFRTTQGIDHEGWVRGLTAGAIEAASKLSLLPNLPAIRGPHPQQGRTRPVNIGSHALVQAAGAES